MPTRNVLLARAEMDGAVREPGYIFTLQDGQLGPHRTVVASNHGSQIADHMNGAGPLTDVPLYRVIDEDIERERTEMDARHVEERAELDGSAERDALIAKQAEEAKALRLKAAKRDLELKHERENDALKERQHAEQSAFEAREESAPLRLAPAPRETTLEDLDARHKSEADALAETHAREEAALEGRKPEGESEALKQRPLFDASQRQDGPQGGPPLLDASQHQGAEQGGPLPSGVGEQASQKIPAQV